MPEKNIKSFDEYLRRWYKRTTKHILDDNMDFDESIDAAIEETGDEVVLDIEKEFIAQVLKMIFGK
jgi:hypothetical protein